MNRQLPPPDEKDPEYSDFVDIEGESEDISELQQDIDAQMDRLFEEFGGDPRDTELKINVRRVIPNKGETEHCFSCLPNELPILERIRGDFGPGEYQIWIYKNGRIWKRRKTNIAKPLDKPVTSEIQGMNNVPEFLTAMQQAQERQWQQMQQMMSVNATPQKSRGEEMRETLEMLALMKNVLGGNETTVNPMSQMKQVMEMAKDFADMAGAGGEKTTSDTLYMLAEKALPMLIEGAKNPASNNPHDKNQAPLSTMVPIQPSGIQPGEGPAIPNPPTNENPEMLIKRLVKAQLPKLINLARQDKDTGLYSDLILDQIPDTFIDRYITFIKQSDAIDQLAIMNPDINNVRPWFDRFRADTLERIEEMESESEPESGSDLTTGKVIDQNSEHGTGHSFEEKPDNGAT